MSIATSIASALCGAIIFLLVKDFTQNHLISILASLSIMLSLLIWINSTIPMDYIWGLLFLLLSYYFASSGKFLLFGISAGLTAASKLQYLPPALLPLIFLLVLKKIDKKKSI